ncbi:MAG: hypothetical protein FWE78_05145, partial [Methanimicrococcus sp.]|nr:hypothetical protein [Methanimicrococcus sp.]
MKVYKQFAAFCLVLILLLNLFGGFTLAAKTQDTASQVYIITSNPYENVDWQTYTQYKANFHAHSTNSDGDNLTSEMVEDHYAKGFDILAMTDHNYTTFGWSVVDEGPLAPARVTGIETGAGRNGKGMIGITPANEQSSVDHINTFWASYNNTVAGNLTAVQKMDETLKIAEKSGGISHINHPGRYTGGANSNDTVSKAASNDAAAVQKYVDFFMTYPSCVGLEIINKIDGESKSDRILWDNILKKTMPHGRSVWGFSNDDTHSTNATG